MNTDTYETPQQPATGDDKLNEVSEWIGKHLSSRIVLGSLSVFVVTMGLTVALIASLSRQDIRQSANYSPQTCANAFTITAPQAGLYVQPTTDNVWPWTNNGPTVAWTSPVTNISTICNDTNCWQFQPGTGWLNNGVPKTLNDSLGGLWNNAAPSAAWEEYGAQRIDFTVGMAKLIYDRASNSITTDSVTSDSLETAAWTDPINDYATVCNGSNCRSWNNVTKAWRTTGYDISANATWQALQGGGPSQIKPWTDGGPTSAWTDKDNKKSTICNKGWCWIYYYTADGGPVGFRDGAPYSMCKAFSPAGADASCQY